jgi:hypothetical protein
MLNVNANNNILLGDAITNVPAVVDSVVIGNGTKVGMASNEILIGDKCAASGAAGRVSFGSSCEAVGGTAALPQANPENWLSINYNGVRYYIGLYTTAP